MLPKEIIRQVRRIEIKTGRLVNEIFAGAYSSVFKGRGMEFAEVREYQPGDDIRGIDWNVTARFGHPFVKKHVEERELTVMLVMDASASTAFGSADRFKAELMAEIAAVLAFSAIGNNDKVGTVIVTDTVEKFIPPQKGRTHILRIIREILFHTPRSRATRLEAALNHVNEVQKRRSIVFIISDFIDQGYERALRITNRRHDVVCIQVRDPRERELPRAGLVDLCDLETGRRMTIDTSDERYQAAAAERLRAADEQRAGFFAASGIDAITLTCGSSYIEPLMRFFAMRARRFR